MVNLYDLAMKAAVLMAEGEETAASGGDFKLTSLLKGGINFLQEIGGYIVVLAGVILLIVGIVQIVKGLAGGGKGQTNWVMSIGCLIVGGALMFGGWTLLTSLSKAGGGALQEMNDAGTAQDAQLHDYKGL